ncbi:hypothetical protein [Streptomyces sp. SBT349]|uniref:hypothetical protein n=1 Tax=Streptomyces sp. SBT349 TaxID=1580539 RepID=UPI00066E228F|nr:hypothetical protein [Streptomyces sp. SBT349]
MAGSERVRIGAPRGLVAVTAGVAAGWLALAWAASRGQLSALPPVALALAALTAWHGARLLRERVVLTPTGVHERRLSGAGTVIPWHHLRLITVAPGAVELLTRDGERRRPAALRGGLGVTPGRFAARVELLRSAVPEGEAVTVGTAGPSGGWNGRRLGALWAAVLVGTGVLTGAALRADAPWQADWWPGGEVLADVPDPCAVSEDAARALGTQWRQPPEPPPGGGDDGPETDLCAYDGDRGRLTVAFDRYPWRGSSAEAPADAAGAAYYAAGTFAMEAEEIAGATWHVSRDERGQEMWLLRSNVWATVRYHDYGPDEAPELPEDLDVELTALAEDVVRALG